MNFRWEDELLVEALGCNNKLLELKKEFDIVSRELYVVAITILTGECLVAVSSI